MPIHSHCTSYYSECPSKCKAWACDDGFTQKGNYCEKVCEVETCTGYGLSACPSHGNCSTCTLVGSNCAQGATKYKLDSCQSGYTKSGDSCIPDKDPCDDVTAVKVPANAHCTSYYSECPSKCKAWACDDGYVTLIGGTSCVKKLDLAPLPTLDKCPSGYSLGDGCSCPYGRSIATSTQGNTCYKCCSQPVPGGFKCASCDVSNAPVETPSKTHCNGGLARTVCQCGGFHTKWTQPHNCN